MRFNNEAEFNRIHNLICENNCWNKISGQYEAEELECPICGTIHTPKQTYFNPEANPQYDEDGRKVGSGEYRDIEFEGEIPNESMLEVDFSELMDFERVTFWQAGKDEDNLFFDGDKLSLEDLTWLDKKYPDVFVLYVWYGEAEGRADLIVEFKE